MELARELVGAKELLQTAKTLLDAEVESVLLSSVFLSSVIIYKENLDNSRGRVDKRDRFVLCLTQAPEPTLNELTLSEDQTRPRISVNTPTLPLISALPELTLSSEPLLDYLPSDLSSDLETNHSSDLSLGFTGYSLVVRCYRCWF